MYHIEKGDCVNKFWSYENNLVSTYVIFRLIGIAAGMEITIRSATKVSEAKMIKEG